MGVFTARDKDPVPQFLLRGEHLKEPKMENGKTDYYDEPAPQTGYEPKPREHVPGFTDEQYVADSLDRLNHRKMKKIATEMLAGREDKPMTVVELADMMAEWADKNRPFRE